MFSKTKKGLSQHESIIQFIENSWYLHFHKWLLRISSTCTSDVWLTADPVNACFRAPFKHIGEYNSIYGKQREAHKKIPREVFRIFIQAILQITVISLIGIGILIGILIHTY